MQLILWYFIRLIYKPAWNFNATEHALQSNGAQQSCPKKIQSVLHEKAMTSLRMASTARDKPHRRVGYPYEFSPILCGEAGIL